MAVTFAGTTNAINRGPDATKAANGADMVEDWEAARADVDTPGAKGIVRDRHPSMILLPLVRHASEQYRT